MRGIYLVSDMEIEAENEEDEYTPNKDLSPATSEEMHMARADVYDNGIPPTPAKWQRAFKWSYCKASDALDRIRQEFGSPAAV